MQNKNKKDEEITELRPPSFQEYIGQDASIRSLKLFIDAAKQRGYSSEHVLLYGPPGIGKTTLSRIISTELNGTLHTTSGAVLQKTGDIAAILTNLKENDVFFIDEIHRMPRSVEEMLYPVMEDYALDIIIGKGPSARTVRLSIPKITIVGATTKLALLSAPLRDRFGLLLRLDYYSEDDICKIIKRSAIHFGIIISDEAVLEIAKRSRKTPRIANRLIKRARDISIVENHKIIDFYVISKLFSILDIDDAGLTDIDMQYLIMIADKFQNSPIGIETIASALSEDKRTIEEFIEPYLLQIGFIKKTPRGRIVSERGLRHIEKK